MNIPDLITYSQDGRKSVKELYQSFLQLQEKGWIAEIICKSTCVWKGEKISLPLISLRTPNKGNSVWILSGIHGEEPAGPNAIAEGIEYIEKLGEKVPVVLIPLCNPLGYVKNWRYLNQQKWSPDSEGQSVGDSEHLLPDIKNPSKPRRNKFSNKIAAALTKYIVKLEKIYRPIISFDFHEDDLIPKGYIYSQGKFLEKDTIAKKVVNLLLKNKIPIKMNGKTRFDEFISKGIVVSDGKDGSIDELLAAEKIFWNNKIINKPYAKTALVLETPAANMKLETRKKAHLAVLKSILDLIR